MLMEVIVGDRLLNDLKNQYYWESVVFKLIVYEYVEDSTNNRETLNSRSAKENLRKN